MGVIDSSISSIVSTLSSTYQSFASSLSPQGQVFLNLFTLTLIVAAYAFFVWKFYIFISTRDILKLDLRKYNTASHPGVAKLVGGLLYLAEYLIILPLLVFFWFAVFTLLLLLVTKGLQPSAIVLISALTIAAVRMLCYIPKYGETVASELAKIIPLTLLGLSITAPTFFNLSEILSQLGQIQTVFTGIRTYLIFIVGLELVMRALTFVAGLIKPSWIYPEEEDEVEPVKKKASKKKK